MVTSIQLRGLLMLAVCFTLSTCQEYEDYRDYADAYGQQDNLYADYAMKQQNKAAADGGGGPGLGKMLLVGGLGWFAGGTIHSKRLKSKMKRNHMKEQKTLYAQYYNDVYKIQQQNAELTYVAEQIQEALKQMESDREMEAVQRDYDEFKSPDIDGDDRISRAEFNMYVKNYLSNYPGLSEADYPKFDDFDHDGDGFINFQEYAQQMALQVSQAEKAHTKK